jgi:hypothetical protein
MPRRTAARFTLSGERFKILEICSSDLVCASSTSCRCSLKDHRIFAALTIDHASAPAATTRCTTDVPTPRVRPIFRMPLPSLLGFVFPTLQCFIPQRFSSAPLEPRRILALVRRRGGSRPRGPLQRDADSFTARPRSRSRTLAAIAPVIRVGVGVAGPVVFFNYLETGRVTCGIVRPPRRLPRRAPRRRSRQLDRRHHANSERGPQRDDGLDGQICQPPSRRPVVPCAARC